MTNALLKYEGEPTFESDETASLSEPSRSPRKDVCGGAHRRSEGALNEFEPEPPPPPHTYTGEFLRERFEIDAQPCLSIRSSVDKTLLK